MTADDVFVGLDEAAVAVFRERVRSILIDRASLDEQIEDFFDEVLDDIDEAARAALATVPRPATQPEVPDVDRWRGTPYLRACPSCGAGPGQACLSLADLPQGRTVAYEPPHEPRNAAPSQPAHGEALTEAERRIIHRADLIAKDNQTGDYGTAYADGLRSAAAEVAAARLAAQPAHGDNGPNPSPELDARYAEAKTQYDAERAARQAAEGGDDQ